MKVLVTGHRGLLGSACVRRLGLQHDIITYPGNLLENWELNQFLWKHKPQAIIHCAAQVGGVRANRDYPVPFLTNNLKIQQAIIDAAVFHKVEKFVFVATSCLYPRNCPTPVKEESLLSGPFEPSVQSYAIAKLAGYELCKAHASQYGRNFMTVAPSNLYGPNDSYGSNSHVIPALIQRFHQTLATGCQFEVWGDGSAVREFLYVDDAADAIGVVLQKWNRPDLINIGTGVGTKISELVDSIKSVCNRPDIPTIWDKSQPTGIPEKTFDISKLSSLGWKPKIDLIDGLELTWKDYAETTANDTIRIK